MTKKKCFQLFRLACIAFFIENVIEKYHKIKYALFIKNIYWK